MARPLIVDGRNFLDPMPLCARPGSATRASDGLYPTLACRASRTEVVQAIVLVGGEGTRLRPLTEFVPKPALTLVDRPFLAYMVEWLAGHGVKEVVLACGFLPDVLREALGRRRARRRPDPLRRRARARWAPAGAIRFAADELGDELDDRFLALNGDVLTDLDLTALLDAHDERGARATLGLLPGRRRRRLRPRAHAARTARSLSFLEKTGAARARARSTPGRTCSSARCST